MDRDQLIDLTRRAVKLARDKTTDLTPSEHSVAADTYTSTQTPRTGHGDAVGQSAARRLCLRTSPARHLLHQDGYGPVDSADPRRRQHVRAFDNVCLHRQSRIADGCGAARRLACPYHSWTYDLDGNLVGIPGKEGFPETRSGPAKLTELPAAECAGFLWISLDRDTTLDIPAFLGPLADELESWGIGRWSPLGEKVLDCPINWKLAIDTFAENYHFATVHKNTFATIARSNCTVLIRSARTTDLSFPSTEFSISRTFRRSSGIRCTTWWSSTRCSRTSCCRARSPMGNCSASIPPMCRAGRSPCTRTRPHWICPTSRRPRRGGGLRLRARHGPRRGLRTGGRPAGQPGVGCAGDIWCSAATNLGCSTATKRGKRRSAVERDAMREIWRCLRARGHVRRGVPPPGRRPTPSPGTAPAIAHRTRSRSPVLREVSRGTDRGPPCTPAATHAPAPRPTAPRSSPGRVRAMSVDAGQACSAPWTVAGPTS